MESKFLIVFGVLAVAMLLSGCLGTVSKSSDPNEALLADKVACDADNACLEGECIGLPEKGMTCMPEDFVADPCASYACPDDTTCAVAESYPPQLICSEESEEEGEQTTEHEV